MVKRRIGVLTGGGDTTALNATLKGVALAAEKHGLELIGFMEGWAGVLTPDEHHRNWGRYCHLTSDMIDENQGGTILRSSRTNVRKIRRDAGPPVNEIGAVVENLKKLDISGLIPIGGDDTLTVGSALAEHFTTTFVTKTIDNDVGTNAPEGDPIDYESIVNYFCPGFATAALRVAQFARELRTTAYSHKRVIVLESMGRHAGWLALAGAYGYADIILVPEIAWDPQPVIDAVARIYEQQGYAIIVASEGMRNAEGELLSAVDAQGDEFRAKKAGGCSRLIASNLQEALSRKLGTEAFNPIIPGYLYRCGSPIPRDRDLAISLGMMAVEALLAEKVNHVATIVRSRERLIAKLLPMEQVIPRHANGAVITRKLDLRFYDREQLNISPAGLEYFRPILGERPQAYRPPDVKTRTIGTG